MAEDNCKVALHGLILAAGRGRRMGQPKATLKWRGRLFVDWQAEALLKAGAEQVTVVLPEGLEAPGALPQGCHVCSGDSRMPQFHSLLVGLGAVRDSGGAAAIVGPVDQGPYRAGLPAALLREGEVGADVMRVPEYEGTPGHPVLLGADVVRELLEQDPELEGGLGAFIEQRKRSLRRVPVEFEETCRNLNSREQLESFLEESKIENRERGGP